MRSRKKTLTMAALVGLAAALVGYCTVPRTPESCQAVHEQMLQLMLNDSSLANIIAAALPENMLDEALAERYGAMTAQQCTALLPSLSSGLEAFSGTKWAPRMQQAEDEAKQAIKECHDKRVSGELKTHAQSAECSSPKITAAYQRINYPYMDLVAQFMARRLELAQKLDKSTSDAAEDPRDLARIALDIAEAERQRVSGKN